MDVSKHHGKCYVRWNNKYTCLNSTCLVHSWICMEHPEENRPLIEAHYREAAKTQQPLKLEAKNNSNLGVINVASDEENSDEIPPAEPPPAYFSSNILWGKKATKVLCTSGCVHNLMHNTTRKTLTAQVTDDNACPNCPHTKPAEIP